MRCHLHWFWIALCCLGALRAQAARNVTISALPTAGGNFSAGVFTPTADDANVSTNELDEFIGFGVSVTITTGNTGTQAGDIIVIDPIAPSGAATGSLTLNAAGSVALNGSIALGGAGGNFIVSASGPISQTAPLTVSGTVSFTTGAAAIALPQTNHINGAISFTNSGANDVSFTNMSATMLRASNIGGNLSVTSIGDISQNGVLTISGSASFFLAPNVTLNQFNQISGPVLFGQVVNVQFNNGLPVVLGASQAAGSFFTSANGTINQTGPLSIGSGASFYAAGNSIDLDSPSNSFNGLVAFIGGGAYNVVIAAKTSLLLGGLNTTGNFTATSAGGITETAPITALGTATLTGAAVNFTNANNVVGGAILNTSGDATFLNASDLVLGRSTVGGNLTIKAGAITQTDALNVGGTASFDAGGYSITLMQSNVVAKANFTNVFDVSLRTTSPLLLGSSFIRDNLGIIANGDISESARLIVQGTGSFSTVGNILLPLNNLMLGVAFNTGGPYDVSLNIFGPNVSLGTCIVGRNLALTVNGPVFQTGAMTVGGTATFSTGSDFFLTQANHFSNTVSITAAGGNASISSVLPLTLDTAGFFQNLTVSVPPDAVVTLTNNVNVNAAFTVSAPVRLAADIALTAQYMTWQGALIGNGHTLTVIGPVALYGTNIEAVNSHFNFQNSFSVGSAALHLKDWNGKNFGNGASQILAGNSAASLSSNDLIKVFFDNPAGAPGTTNPATVLATGEVVPGPVPSAQTLQQGAGEALNFAAASHQFVQIHDAPDLVPQNLTLEAWINPHTVSCGAIVSRGDGSDQFTDYIFEVGYDGTNCGAPKLAFFCARAWDATTNTVPTDTWTHVAVTYDGTNKQFYINGVPDISATRSAGFDRTPSPVYIGRQGFNCNCNSFDGEIDEVRIWNVVRTPAQIQANIHHRLLGSESGLVAYYRMDEGAGTTNFDSTMNTNNGVFGPGTNAPTWVNAGEVLGSPLLSSFLASSVKSTFAMLNGTVNPEAQTSGAWFDWGTTPAYGSSTTITNVGNGTNGIPVSSTLSGLTPGATYYYRFVATNSSGTSLGPDLSFTLPSAKLAAQYSAPANALILSWSNAAAILQSATNVTGPYSDLPFVSSPHTNAAGSSPQMFFRFRE